MSKKYLVRNENLTGLVKFMNANFNKQTEKPFTSGDVQQYISRGHIPEYLGANRIEREDGYVNVKLYKIVKNDTTESRTTAV